MSPHLSGRCSCGRRIHFPKQAKRGYEWKCNDCGTVWVMSDRGDPLDWHGSKKPTVGARPKTTGGGTTKGRSSGGDGCLTVLVGLAGVLYTVVFVAVTGAAKGLDFLYNAVRDLYRIDM